MTRRLRHTALFGAYLAAAALAVNAGVALAQSDDRGSAEATLRDVASSPHRASAAELEKRARGALDRAAQLRASRDEAHARLADGLARIWAEAARDVVRAVALEEKARSARLVATDAGAHADRERALLEEGLARTGRIRAQLDSVARDKEQPAKTSAAANAERDGGAR